MFAWSRLTCRQTAVTSSGEAGSMASITRFIPREKSLLPPIAAATAILTCGFVAFTVYMQREQERIAELEKRRGHRHFTSDSSH